MELCSLCSIPSAWAPSWMCVCWACQLNATSARDSGKQARMRFQKAVQPES